jgi:hypothetical protein
VLTFSRRLAALAVVFAIAAGNLALCAGWEATPQARMACCANGGTCPMHKSDGHRSTERRLVSQSEADNCCASSERGGSTPSTPTFASTMSVALIPAGFPILLPPPSRVDAWRPDIPRPIGTIPKHLLLSVLLV